MRPGVGNETSGAAMINDVCLISPNDISREGLGFILKAEQFNIIGSYQGLPGIDQGLGDVEFLAIVDYPDPSDQADVAQQVKERFPGAIVTILAERFDLRAMVHCFNNGADGYIVKSMKSMPLIAALRLAALGEKVLPPDIIQLLGNYAVEPAATDAEPDIEEAKLSQRELDVLCGLMAGYANKVIARQLNVCEATVKVHVKAILRKLHVRNRTQAAIWASSRHLSESGHHPEA